MSVIAVFPLKTGDSMFVGFDSQNTSSLVKTWMFGFEFGERGGGVSGEALEDHLEALAAAGGNLVLWADFLLLQGVLVHVVECAPVV